MLKSATLLTRLRYPSTREIKMEYEVQLSTDLVLNNKVKK